MKGESTDDVITHVDSLGRRGYSTFEAVCLSICSELNLKTNYPKEFKLGTGNDLEIAWK